MNPLEWRQREEHRDRQMALAEHARQDALAEAMRLEMDPTARLIRQVADLRERVEQLELEQARQRHLQSRGEM
jgi:hypothetical protein